MVTRAAQRSIERGGIWIVPLDPTQGHEQQGTRPVLVLSSSDFNSHFGKCYIAPITQGGNAARYGGYAVSLMGTGLHTQGVVLLTDVRALDLRARHARHIENVPAVVLEDILARMATLFEE